MTTLLFGLALANPTMQTGATFIGEPGSVYVFGAPANTQAYLVIGTTGGGGPCPAALQGGCFQMADARFLGGTTTDGQGNALLTFDVPAGLPDDAVRKLEVAFVGYPNANAVTDARFCFDDDGDFLCNSDDTCLGDNAAGDVDLDGVCADLDCDDADATVFPGAPELCGDGVLQDCDRVDETGVMSFEDPNGGHTPVDYVGGLDLYLEGTLHVCAGTYTDPVTIAGPVDITGHDADGPVVLLGDGQRSLVFDDHATSTVRDLTLQGVAPATGGGATVSSQALVVFDNVHASDCVADEGGAVRSDGDLTVLGGTFTANEAALGGAIFSSTDLTIDGTTFDGNVATDDGGAVHAAGHVEVFDATLGGNTAAMGDGGAIVATSLLTGTVDFSGNAPFDVSVAGNSDDLGLGSAHTCDSYGCQSLP